MLKVLMIPHELQVAGHAESGIKTLIKKYFKYLPDAGIELVLPNAESFDLTAIHAGMASHMPNGPIVAHIHGLYWTADLSSQDWQHRANANVINSILNATVVTTPSEWTAQTLRRDMHLSPIVVPHAVDVEEWEDAETAEHPYVLWNKNRNSDVCDPRYVALLARARPDLLFMSTYSDATDLPNVRVTGLVNHSDMKRIVKQCGVYLSTTKETFGIGILEAMASGKPILGFAEGGIKGLVQHGVNGYLAQPNNFDDLMDGLNYCIQHAKVLGANSKRLAQNYRWPDIAMLLSSIYKAAYELHQSISKPEVSVVIPSYNKAGTLRRAVTSVIEQTHRPKRIIIINNNSTDSTEQIAHDLQQEFAGFSILYANEPKQGVAHARNLGCEMADTKYVCCLDADDEILPDFLKTCIASLEENRTLGLAYTLMEVADLDGNIHNPEWPGVYNFDEFLVRKNQVPTCCVFRRDVWQRLGGYRQRYAPQGAGAEDAEFWLRMGAAGYPGILASKRRLFRYHLGGAVGGNPNYREADWLSWHPWVKDTRHPIASAAKPANGKAHLVPQYDQPLVSIVIPLSKNHIEHVVDALDSLESQTFRRWEAIVVCDGFPVPPRLAVAYPYARWIEMASKGAGAARNMGAARASSSLLLFLDADDWLEPTATHDMLTMYHRFGGIVYTDYIGHAIIDDEEAARLERAHRLISYDAKTHASVIRHRSAPYDCDRAQQQPHLEPNGQFYIWNLITSLVPKSLHQSIGGFDESMPSWEDWDYWIRLARRNECFNQLSKPLVHYRFNTGTRRETGKEAHAELVRYMVDKYRKEPPMACGGCSKPKQTIRPPEAVPASRAVAPMSSGDMVFVELTDGNIGDHPIRIRDLKTNKVTDYSYRKSGDMFYMHREHARLYPNKFRIVEVAPPEPEIVIAPPEPQPIVEAPSYMDDDDGEVLAPLKMAQVKEETQEQVVAVKKPATRKHTTRKGTKKA